MPQNKKVKYPDMRINLLDTLNSLRDAVLQKKLWVEQASYYGREYDCFDEAVHFLYDDTFLSVDPNAYIDIILSSKEEAIAIEDVTKAIDMIFDKYGVHLTDEEYISKPEWREVILAAKEALKACLKSQFTQVEAGEASD